MLKSFATMPTKLVQSPRIDERYTCFHLKIRKSKIHRFGVYADQRIPAARLHEVLAERDKFGREANTWFCEDTFLTRLD